MVMGDVDIDGVPEFIFLASEVIHIYKMGNQSLVPLYSYPYKGYGDLVNVSVGLNGTIAVNVYKKGEGMDSLLLQYIDGKIVTLVDHVPYIIGYFDLDNNGTRESLVGETFDREHIFGSQVFVLKIMGNGKLVPSAPIPVPSGFRLIGAEFADLNGDGINEIYSIDPDHRFLVYENGARIWASKDWIGGTSEVVLSEVGSPSESYKIAIPVEVQPLLVDVDRDGIREILFVRNGTKHGPLVGDLALFHESWIVELHKTQMGYRLLPFAGPFSQPVQGLVRTKDRIMAILIKGNPFISKGESKIIGFPLIPPTR